VVGISASPGYFNLQLTADAAARADVMNAAVCPTLASADVMAITK